YCGWRWRVEAAAEMAEARNRQAKGERPATGSKAAVEARRRPAERRPRAALIQAMTRARAAAARMTRARAARAPAPGATSPAALEATRTAARPVSPARSCRHSGAGRA